MSMQQVPAHRRVIIGVDTHKYVHAAFAIDELGAFLESRSVVADSGGYTEMIDWAVAFGGRLTCGIEGTGSYGAGLTSAVRRHDIGTVEVVRTDRRDRRLGASPTPSTPRTPPVRSSPAKQPRFRRPRMAPSR